MHGRQLCLPGAILIRELDNRESVLRALEDLEDKKRDWNDSSPVASRDSLIATRYFILYLDPVYFMDEPALVQTAEGTILMEWCDFDSEEYISFEFLDGEVSCHVKDTSGIKAKWTLEQQSHKSILRAQKLLVNYYNDKRPVD